MSANHKYTYRDATAPPEPQASVLLPLLYREGEWQILYELRSKKLDVQPGEVCFPGGGASPGETPVETVLRETCEELLIAREQITLLGEAEPVMGPRGIFLHFFYGTLSEYKNTFDPIEVDHVFTIPVSWLLDNPPERYEIPLEPRFPADFPHDLLPGGRNYPWSIRSHEVFFYHHPHALLWGLTANLTRMFLESYLRAIDLPDPDKEEPV